MNLMMWIDKQSNGSLPGRLGRHSRTRSLRVVREARAPPTAVAITG
jgi:hypothetical protein